MGVMMSANGSNVRFAPINRQSMTWKCAAKPKGL